MPCVARANGAIESLSIKSEPAAQREESQANSGSFPKISSKAAGWWLIGAAGSVYAIVVLGGLTRLTESG